MQLLLFNTATEEEDQPVDDPDAPEPTEPEEPDNDEDETVAPPGLGEPDGAS